MKNQSPAVTKAAKLLKDQRIRSAPVPVEKIAEDLGAKLSFEPLEGNVSGMLYRDGPVTIIGINSYHSNTRQRFTIAHELGHYLLHKGDVFVDRPFLRDSKSSLAIDKQEIEANQFAAALLMPEELVTEEFIDLIEKRKISSPDILIEELASHFEVSIQAMTIRLQTLELLSVG